MYHSEQKWTYFCFEWCITGYGTDASCELWIWFITSCPPPLLSVPGTQVIIMQDRAIYRLCTYDDVCATRRYQWHGQVITSHRGMQYINLTNPKVPLFHNHNALFRTAMCTFLFWMVHCGIWKRCIMWFVDVVCYLSLPPIPASGTQVLMWCKKPIFTCIHDDMVHVMTPKRLNQGSCVCGTYNKLSLDIHAL